MRKKLFFCFVLIAITSCSEKESFLKQTIEFTLDKFDQLNPQTLNERIWEELDIVQKDQYKWGFSLKYAEFFAIKDFLKSTTPRGDSLKSFLGDTIAKTDLDSFYTELKALEEDLYRSYICLAKKNKENNQNISIIDSDMKTDANKFDCESLVDSDLEKKKSDAYKVILAILSAGERRYYRVRNKLSLSF
eukprot:c16309_g1_i2.p1 GENE.c16309_g1_i2~~c16309_g1_i2.p1  ORF type:complete len:190 (+),score=43.58 c16309_g1_i2:46-615(+)